MPALHKRIYTSIFVTNFLISSACRTFGFVKTVIDTVGTMFFTSSYKCVEGGGGGVIDIQNIFSPKFLTFKALAQKILLPLRL